MPNYKRVHFIAIGGAVMHNLALALHDKGLEITGSDDKIYNPARDRLAEAGILPKQEGWFADKISQEVEAIILGMHAKKDNPELLKAQELGIPIFSFPEFVFQQSQNKQRVVIAGSHGKTTITSIILHVLNHYERKFDFLSGAQIDGFDRMVQLTQDAPVIIIEGDEYLASPLEPISKFHFYKPHIVLMSGIAWDHFNVFPQFDDYVKTFEKLVDDIPKAGSFIFDETDDIVKVIGNKEREDVKYFPYSAHPYEVSNGKVQLQLKDGTVPVELFGEHNMKNLHGAKLVLNRLGITDAMFYEAIQSFKGASKRLEKLTESQHASFYRDFAHAPSKVKATTAAASELYPDRELVACYELHTFSSLDKNFLPQYEDSLSNADVAIVYYSPETLKQKNRPAISEEEIKKAFNNTELQVFTQREQLEHYLKSLNWYKKNLLLMSSGTFEGMNFKTFTNELSTLPVDITMPEIEVKSKSKGSKWAGIFKKK